MAVELNHTVVPAHDPRASAQFLADILRLAVDPPLAQFTPVTLANGVSLDFDVDDHHYAFQLSDEEFETAFGRIRHSAITYYADPACRQPDQVYTGANGRRGLYFRDPNGHLMEILTPLPGEARASSRREPAAASTVMDGRVAAVRLSTYPYRLARKLSHRLSSATAHHP